MRKEFDFSKEFGEIDEKFVENAGKEWNRKKCYVFQLYSRKIACIAILVMFCIVVAGNSRVQAAVGKFTTKIGGAFRFTKELSAYTDIINQTQTKNGISLTVKEVIVDDRVLMVLADADFGQSKGVSLWINERKTRINGKWHRPYESWQELVMDSSLDQTLLLVYEDQVLPEGDVKVHLVLEAGELDDSSTLLNASVKGMAEFVYDFEVTAEELKAKTIKQTLDVTVGAFDAEKKNLTLKELTMNDLYCRILAEGFTWNDDWPNQYELKLKGTDSFGNPVSLFGSRFLSENEMLFVTDFYGDYEAGDVVAEDEFQMSVPDKDCDYLDLQLYERKNDTNEENHGWKPVGEPFRIDIRHTEEMVD